MRVTDRQALIRQAVWASRKLAHPNLSVLVAELCDGHPKWTVVADKAEASKGGWQRLLKEIRKEILKG